MQNAKNAKLSDTSLGLPDLSSGVEMFLQRISVNIVRKKQVDGYTKEFIENLTTLAVKQPFTSQQLLVKPEGERAWKWYTLHSKTDLNLKPDDIVILNNTEYRVMEKDDFQEYGFYRYNIIESYQKNEN